MALFTSDAGVQSALTLALWVLAAGQPLAGYVFVLDGVLIGAGDAKYLAIAGVVNLAVYLPLLLAVAGSGLSTAPRACLAVGGLLAGLHARPRRDAGPPGADGPLDGARSSPGRPDPGPVAGSAAH